MDPRKLLEPRIAGGLAAAVTLLVVISLQDSVRLAILVAAICAIAVATRVRYTPYAALTLLALTALLALTGNGPAASERPSHTPATAAQGR